MIKQATGPVTAGFDIGPAYHAEGEFIPVSKIKAVDTIVDKLRWEPVVKSSSWRTVPDTIRKQVLTLAAIDPASHELEALIRGAGDNTLNVSWAESKSGPNPDVIGWAIANVWPTVAGDEGVILVFLHPDFNNVKVHQLLTQRLLDSLVPDGLPAGVDIETVLNVSRRDQTLVEFLYMKGFQTVNTILP